MKDQEPRELEKEVKSLWVAIRGCTEARSGNRGALPFPSIHINASILLYITSWRYAVDLILFTHLLCAFCHNTISANTHGLQTLSASLHVQPECPKTLRLQWMQTLTNISIHTFHFYIEVVSAFSKRKTTKRGGKIATLSHLLVLYGFNFFHFMKCLSFFQLTHLDRINIIYTIIESFLEFSEILYAAVNFVSLCASTHTHKSQFKIITVQRFVKWCKNVEKDFFVFYIKYFLQPYYRILNKKCGILLKNRKL